MNLGGGGGGEKKKKGGGGGGGGKGERIRLSVVVVYDGAHL